MTYRGSLARFVLLILAYMLIVAVVCALWILESPSPAPSTPRRTRPAAEAP